MEGNILAYALTSQQNSLRTLSVRLYLSRGFEQETLTQNIAVGSVEFDADEGVALELRRAER